MKLTGSDNPDFATRPPNFSDADFTADLVYDPDIVTPGSEVYRQDYDVILKDTTPSTIDPAWNFYFRELVPGTLTRPVNVSSTTNKASVSGGRISRVADGTARLLAAPAWPTRSFGNPDTGLDLDFTRQTGVSKTEFIRYADGSLAKKCSDTIDTLLVGKTAANKPMFTSYGVRNAGCWIDAKKLAGSSLDQPRMHAISPWICVGAEHYYQNIGNTVDFLGTDGVVYTRTIANKLDIGPANSSDAYKTDIRLYLLDSALPAAVPPYKVMPTGWEPKYMRKWSSYGVPVVYMDQEGKALVADFVLSGPYFNTFRQPTNAQRAIFFEQLVGGDSANGAWLLINGEAVLVTTWTFAGPSGPDYDANFAAINTAMNTLRAGEAQTVVDLSGEMIWDFSDYVQSLNPHVWWRLGDVTANGQTAADSGSLGLGAVVNGTLSQVSGLVANDSNKAVSFTDCKLVTSGGTSGWDGDITWGVLVNSAYSGLQRTVVGHRIANETSDFVFKINSTNIVLNWYGSGSWRTVNSSSGIHASTNCLAFAVRSNSATKIDYYIDGASVGGGTLPANSPYANGYQITIGDDYYADQKFTGTMDEVMGWKSALSQPQIERIYRLSRNIWPTPSP